MEDTIIDEHRARAYTALALAFDRPGDDLAAALKSGAMARTLREVASVLDLTAFSEAATAIEEAQPTRSTLADAYADAFGLEGSGEVSQYELAYAPGSLVTNTDQLADINGFYSAFGLAIAEGARDRPDALVTELEYVGLLALRRTQYRDRGDDEGYEVASDATAAFLEDHLGRWIPRFVEAAAAVLDDQVYLALVEALAALVEDDIDRFEVDPFVFEETPTAPLESITDFDDADGRLELSCGAASTCTIPHPSQQ